tara:strand:- start:6744 stop:7577 length:834 start_codon:yes stop_codon:yes gene_type:complete
VYDSATGTGGITHGALSGYFEMASRGLSPDTIDTTIGSTPAAGVMLASTWIKRATDEAEQRAAHVAGYAQTINDSTFAAVTVNSRPAANHASTPDIPSGSTPGYLKTRQTQQRQQSERSAVEQLDAALARAQQLEQKAISLEARLAIKEIQAQQLIEECEQHRRDASDQRRARLVAEDAQIVMEEQLEKVMVLAEFMNADNPLSPPDGRELIECWSDVTHDGTVDPTKSSGNGWHIICAAWLNKHTASPSEIKGKRFAALLTPLASKKGGTIPTPRK